MKTALLFIFLLVCSISYSQLPGNCECIQPDNGTGTIDIPAICPDSSDLATPLLIIDGMPPGTTIEINGVITGYFNQISVPGGTLGGETHNYNANLQLEMTGTGDLLGFSRLIQMPIVVELHSAPRTPGDPVQSFLIDVFTFQGSVFGDPDFDQLVITAGSNFGLLSPGQMTLTDLDDGTYNVESFYDLNYQIDFVGAPGSAIEGLAGATLGVRRFSQGSTACIIPPIPTLSQWGVIILGLSMVVLGMLYFKKRSLILNMN